MTNLEQSYIIYKNINNLRSFYNLQNSEFYMNSIYSTNKQILRIRLKILYNLTNRDLFLLCKYIDLPFVVYVFGS